MKKNILQWGGVAIGFLVLLGAFAAYHTNEIHKRDQLLQAKDIELNELNDNLDKEEEKNAILSDTNQEYKDSIVFLHKEIARLKEVILAKDEQIKYLKGKLKRRNVAYQDLKDKIARLYKKADLDKKTIKKLEAEKAYLRKEMKVIRAKTKDAFAARSVAEEKLASSEVDLSQMTEIQDVAAFTKVLYEEITPRKFKQGRKISKMRRNMNGWGFTDIRFKLDHPNHRLLVDRNFTLKIYDTENNIYLAYLEDNPKFPQSSQKGIPFTFDGNMVELTYINSQEKKSENYEIRIFLLENGSEIPLTNGKKTLVSNGRFKS